MIGLPTIHLEGTLVTDPELRFTPKGHPVTKFRVACNGVNDKTTFLDVNSWQDTAENVAETLRKGDRVVVIGHLTQRDWEDAKGNKRVSYAVESESVGPSLAKASVTLTRTVKSPGGNATTKDPGLDPWATT